MSVEASSSPGGSGGAVVAIVVVLVIAVVVLRQALKKPPVPAAPAWTRPKPTNSVQLRQDINGTWVMTKTLFGRKSMWFLGTGCPPIRHTPEQYTQIQQQQVQVPVRIGAIAPRAWWQYQGLYWWESGGYSPQDVHALLLSKQRKSQQQLEHAHAMMHVGQLPPSARRVGIPRDLKQAVFQRDGGVCRECGSNFEIQYDHIIPVALGGATTFENLQLLCGSCNRAKSATI